MVCDLDRFEVRTNFTGTTTKLYAFERGAEKTGGGKGWADVWSRGHFAWEC